MSDTKLFRGVRVPVTPDSILSPEERRDRVSPGSPFFMVRFDDETGVYRDCKACDGYGEFPRPADGPKGCQFCEVLRDEDFAKFSTENPPLTFKYDNPGHMEVLKKHFGIDALAAATKDESAFSQHWEDAKMALIKTGVHYVFLCAKCGKEHVRAQDKGLGSFDSPRNHRVFCCDGMAVFHHKSEGVSA